MGQDMAAVFREKWEPLQEKLLTILSNETDNYRIQTILELAGENMSNGMYNFTILCTAHTVK